MRRLFRFFAILAVLLGLVPCEIREALPVLAEVVAACCAKEAEAADHDEGEVDCCDTAACLFAARATAPIPMTGVLVLDGYLLVDNALRVDRPDRRVGPPPTPPPIV